ncbi:hypothetical protein ACIRO3_18950 [Streptomyces sp. NPDC102278]|uniref:hypothetical protein n=1 Tax=Streptomyces sp. NPDC102278 TaxID=3366152 RepID=UPI00381C71DC
MEREERQRAQHTGHEVRPPASAGGHGGSYGPPSRRRAIRTPTFAPHDEERQRQEFLTGTVPAAGACVILPVGGAADADTLPSLFVITVHEDERTYGPAPELREAFALLDARGAVETSRGLEVGCAWSGFGGVRPVVKLRLDFRIPRAAPTRSSVSIVVPADPYAEVWHHVLDGGLLGISTKARLDRVTGLPRSSFAAGLEACLLLGTGYSPVLERLITTYEWPRA